MSDNNTNTNPLAGTTFPVAAPPTAEDITSTKAELEAALAAATSSATAPMAATAEIPTVGATGVGDSNAAGTGLGSASSGLGGEGTSGEQNWDHIKRVGALKKSRAGHKYIDLKGSDPKFQDGEFFYKDKKTGSVYKIEVIFCKTPPDQAPDFVLSNLTINLKEATKVS